MYELIIAEKGKNAEKIAQALADDKPKKVKKKVGYFVIHHKGKEIRIGAAAGHLFELGEKGGESWKYPVFETEWRAGYAKDKAKSYLKGYVELLEELGKGASEVIMATDFDVEGELIGLNILRFILGREDASRMKFSTLTKPDIVKAYANKEPTIEWGQARAGETRHVLDWLYGINLSRALTNSVKVAVNKFKVLSTGRVQAPALNFLVEREKKILAFKPEQYIQLTAECVKGKAILEALHVEEKLFDLKKAKEIYEKIKDIKKGDISKVEARKQKQKPPVPFDLTSLQIEANGLFGITPQRTLQIAQVLYTEGVISYPRTSSQQLPKEIGIKKILQDLGKMEGYKEQVGWIIKNTKLQPNQGKKKDPAHPAIYPTGQIPKQLDSYQQKIYDLIVKRFFAVFGNPAERETKKIVILIEGEEFIVKGTTTVDPQWHMLYAPYVRQEEKELPDIKKGEVVDIDAINYAEKETQPPKRYSQSSLLKELEKRNLGTKSTRAVIIESLYARNLIKEKSIKVTELGMRLIDVLNKEIPVITDERLTVRFEEEMEKIRNKKMTGEKVIVEAKKILEKILKDFKEHEIEIGKSLDDANITVMKRAKILGPCPSCNEADLVVKMSKNKKRFIGCSGYPKCTYTLPLPQKGVIQNTEQICPECNHPIIIIKTKGKRPWKLCCNIGCPTKNLKQK